MRTHRWKATRALARSTVSWPRSSSLGGRYHRNRASLSTSPDCCRASHMHDTCSDENDMLRLVCKKSDTVTEPDAAITPLDAELSLSASIQLLPGDRLILPGPPPIVTSLGDCRYDDMTATFFAR